MARSGRNTMIRYAMGVSGNDSSFAVLVNSYYESDPVDSKGLVLRCDAARGGRTELALDCPDPLGTVCMTSDGTLFAGASNGIVWTTSPFGTAAETVDFRSNIPDLSWRRTQLPPTSRQGAPPNIGSMNAIEGGAIYACTFDGSVYQYNGRQWMEMAALSEHALLEVHAAAPDNIYCVGMRATVFHFDGRRWTQLQMPEGTDPHTVCTGVRAAAPGRAFVTTRNGDFFEADRRTLKRLTRLEVPLYGVAMLHGRVIAGSAPGGAWEWTGSELTSIKTGFAAGDVFEVGSRLFFIESEQQPHPQIVEYDPLEEQVPWGRRTFPLS